MRLSIDTEDMHLDLNRTEFWVLEFAKNVAFDGIAVISDSALSRAFHFTDKQVKMAVNELKKFGYFKEVNENSKGIYKIKLEQDGFRTIKEKVIVNEDNEDVKTKQGTVLIDGNEVEIKEVTKNVYARMNELLNQRLRYQSKMNFNLVSDLLKHGYTGKDVITAIEKKYIDWHDDENFSKYLRPSTLFNLNKFENYLNQVVNEQKAINELGKLPGEGFNELGEQIEEINKRTNKTDEDGEAEW